MRNIVVSAAPTSTTNITGFFISETGLSLMNDARTARLMISGSRSGRARISFLGRSEARSSWVVFRLEGGVAVNVGMA
jgi:hypothetical protein